MGVGFGLVMLIGVAGGSMNEGIGVGGFFVIMGLAFFINSLFDHPGDVYRSRAAAIGRLRARSPRSRHGTTSERKFPSRYTPPLHIDTTRPPIHHMMGLYDPSRVKTCNNNAYDKIPPLHEDPAVSVVIGCRIAVDTDMSLVSY